MLPAATISYDLGPEEETDGFVCVWVMERPYLVGDFRELSPQPLMMLRVVVRSMEIRIWNSAHR